MSDLLATLQASHGHLHPRPGFTRRVAESEDLRRVRDLPRREWRDRDVGELSALLTQWLRDRPAPCGMKPCAGCQAQALKPAQAVALQEFADGHGAFLPLRPGAGKTLVSMLLPTVVHAANPLLLIPAMSSGQVKAMRKAYARHWRLKDLTIVTYEFLSAPGQVEYLSTLKPDLIIADESHKLKNPAGKGAKRISAYLKANPGARFVALSGSVMGRSIKEYWHQVRWGLRSMAPVPRDPLEMQAWAYALDSKVSPEARFDPGALLTLGVGTGSTALERGRTAYQSRLLSTPGIVSTHEDVPACGLTLTVKDVPLPPELTRLIERMRDTWQTPSGEDFSLALDLWRHARDLGCGLFYRWDPPAPGEWMHARRNWHGFVRDRLKTARTFDSVVHLVERIKAGQEDGQAYEEWASVRDSFKPNSVPVWVSDHVLDLAGQWIEKHDLPLVWVQQEAFGARLSERAGVPFFSRGARDQRGRLLGTEYTGPAIASMSSCWQSLNLQAWHENLVMCPSSRADRWEQLMARTHRDGQEADDVHVEVWISTPEARACLDQSVQDAYAVEQLKGVPQKLCYANRVDA